jgi:quinol monooxygenase YgiN
VQNESGTTAWFAVRISDSKFAIFDAFNGEEGRQAHLSGDCAKSLLAKADELLVEPLNIQQINILAEKV